jgi:hypothetical protein
MLIVIIMKIRRSNAYIGFGVPRIFESLYQGRLGTPKQEEWG